MRKPSCHEKTFVLQYAETKAQISYAVNMLLISAYVFATFILLSKSEISGL